jgi:S-adenosylmethionine decarboxylase
MPKHFGEHLMIDGYDGDAAKLDDQNLILNCLNELPLKVGMNILAAPSVYKAPGNGKKDPGGWSGFVVINESHISIHTFPKKGFVSCDIYSCRNGMDQEFIINYFKSLFDLKNIEKNFVKRGLEYPQS